MSLHAPVQVFCYTGDKAHEVMRQACFDYLRLGGMYSSGPISLLSGMNPRPSVLVMHFFMVAIFGVGRCGAALAFAVYSCASVGAVDDKLQRMLPGP